MINGQDFLGELLAFGRIFAKISFHILSRFNGGGQRGIYPLLFYKRTNLLQNYFAGIYITELYSLISNLENFAAICLGFVTLAEKERSKAARVVV
jgi:hypothetical protein